MLTAVPALALGLSAVGVTRGYGRDHFFSEATCSRYSAGPLAQLLARS
jgi:hypothetical protein